jgi:hypothetical protein
MATPLAENMRAGNTSRAGAARAKGSRVGAAFGDIQSGPSSGSEYVWSMDQGVKKLDTTLADTAWTESQR